MSSNLRKSNIEEFVRKAQKNDEAAFEALYHHYYPSIYHYALRLARNEADAKDIAQETFIQMKVSLPNLNEPMFFKAWLNRIAYSKAARLFASNKDSNFDIDHFHFQNSQLMVSKSIDMDPLESIHFESDKELLAHFIAQLSLEQQEVILMKYYLQYSMQEIADRSKVPLGTIKSRLYSAKEKLYTLISRYEREHDISLDFKGEALFTLIATYYAMDVTGVATLTSSTTLSFLSRASSVFATGGVKVATVVLSASLLSVGGVYAYKQYEKNSYHSNLNQPMVGANKEEEAFKPVTYAQRTFTRPDDAYYELLRFAHCKKEMESKTAEELKAIVSLYEALKAYDSIYYQALKNANWSTDFEIITNI